MQNDFNTSWLHDFFNKINPEIEKQTNNDAETNEDEGQCKAAKTKQKPTSISIKLDKLAQIPCFFNFDEAEPDEIREFIINSLAQYFSGKSLT